jgi:hypothetical protein
MTGFWMTPDSAIFSNAEAAIAYAKSLAEKLVWQPNYIPGSKLLVFDEDGKTIAEIPIVKALQ